MKPRCLLVALAAVLACLALPQSAQADGPLSFEFPLSPAQLPMTAKCGACNDNGPSWRRYCV